MDVRELMGASDDYYVVNREERFFAALLYSLLLQRGDNLFKFLSLLSEKAGGNLPLNDLDPHACELYFEYTYLRDLWNNIGRESGASGVRRNEIRRNVILGSLKLSEAPKLQTMNVRDFNDFFGAGRIRSSNYEIMSPSNWAVSKFVSSFPDNNEEFLRVCKFKWAFNAKPDLVIQISPKHVVCIEAKLESGEGAYPSSMKDKEIFSRRPLPTVHQTDLQRYMFSELLDMEVTHFFLVRDESETSKHVITWRHVFEELSFENSHPFVRKAIDSNIALKRTKAE